MIFSNGHVVAIAVVRGGGMRDYAVAAVPFSAFDVIVVATLRGKRRDGERAPTALWSRARRSFRRGMTSLGDAPSAADRSEHGESANESPGVSIEGRDGSCECEMAWRVDK